MAPKILSLCLVILCLFFVEVYAENCTQQVNLSIDNNQVSVQSPSGTFQTTCGQQLNKTFDVVLSYERSVNNTFNNTIIYNYTTVVNNSNCTISVNITDNYTSDCSLLLTQMNLTLQSCAQSKATCLDLYNSNISLAFNLSSANLTDAINNSSDDLKAYILNMSQTAASCQQEVLYNQNLYSNCYMDLNVTKIKLDTLEEDRIFFLLTIAALIIAIAVILFMVFGGYLTGRSPHAMSNIQAPTNTQSNIQSSNEVNPK